MHCREAGLVELRSGKAERRCRREGLHLSGISSAMHIYSALSHLVGYHSQRLKLAEGHSRSELGLLCSMAGCLPSPRRQIAAVTRSMWVLSPMLPRDQLAAAIARQICLCLPVMCGSGQRGVLTSVLTTCSTTFQKQAQSFTRGSHAGPSQSKRVDCERSSPTLITQWKAQAVAVLPYNSCMQMCCTTQLGLLSQCSMLQGGERHML